MKPALTDAIKTALGRLQNHIDFTPAFVANDNVEFDAPNNFSNVYELYSLRNITFKEAA